MQVLLLSFYFEPDIGPGAFRSTAWARAIQHQLGANDVVEVLTTRPNRYASFAPASAAEQRDGSLIIHRFDLPAHRSGFLDQSRAFLTYALHVWSHSRNHKCDLVCATSSRLMTAVLGALVARRLRARLFLDVRDLFADAIADVLPRWMKPLQPIFSRLERFAFLRADHINVVSAGFLPYLRRRYPQASLSVITNGIDEAFLSPLSHMVPSPAIRTDRIRVLYAGNIGDGQGLHELLPELAQRLADSHEFIVIGDGGARQRLQHAIAGLPNVSWRAPVDRATLRGFYAEADVLLLHLNDLPAFRKVLPSKLFEYAATGKPILAGVAGHAADFLLDVPGVGLFAPCDVDQAEVALRNLRKGTVDRSAFVEGHRRDRQMAELARACLRTAQGSQGAMPGQP